MSELGLGCVKTVLLVVRAEDNANRTPPAHENAISTGLVGTSLRPKVTFSCADRRFDERTAPFQRCLAPLRESRQTSSRRRPRGQASARRSFRRVSRSRICAGSLRSRL